MDSTAARAPTWFPIDTAPKDGTQVLLYGEDFGQNVGVKIGRWEKNIHEWWERVSDTRQELRSSDDSYWTASDNDGVFPTHWMPLPSPPEREVSK